MTALPRSPVADRLYLAVVALLPLHTVYLRTVIAWKPWLVLVAIISAIDLVAGLRHRALPWDRRVTLGSAVFLATILASIPGGGPSDAFWRLWLALGAGCLLLLISGRHLTDLDRVLKVVFWSSAVMGLTGVILGLVTNGVFGEWAVDAINDIVGIDRVNKPAYLGSGFVALTNWHQDPGYAALWANVWLVLSVFALVRGAVRGPVWLGPLVIGGLAHLTILTLSRTGWFGLAASVVALLVAQIRIDPTRLRAMAATIGAGLLVGAVLVAAQVAVDREGVGGDLVTALDFRFTYLLVLGAINTGEPGPIDPDRIVDDNRIEVWSEYWSRFIEQPLRGIGLGTGWSQTGFQEPHNLWLQLLAETGVMGLLGFVALIASIILVGRSPGPVAGSALAVIGLASLTQTVIFEPILWFGLGLWLAHALKREAETPLKAVT